MGETENEFKPEFLETLKYETPFFLFSKKKILRNLKTFSTYFPNSSIHYAIKANFELGVLDILSKAGCGFEIASKYELDYLKKLHIDPKKIIYGTSVKPISHIKDVFEYGVDRFAFDTYSELEKIAAVASGSRVYARVSVNDTGSVFKMSEKFGAAVKDVVPLMQAAKTLGLQTYGLSFNVGSQASNPKAWAHALGILHPIIVDLEKIGIRIDIINLGGGYPCKYAAAENLPSLEEISEFTFAEYAKLPYQPKLLLEPGRAIIADAGVLITSVIAKLDRSGYTWLFLDAGVYNALFEAMAYQGSTRYPVSSLRTTYNTGDALFALAGPTGDGPDVITREALLPSDIIVGDKIVIHNTGAYSLVATSPFNGFPKPAVYYI